MAGRSSSVAYTYLHKSGEPDDRFDICLLGDGYTSAELTKFHEGAKAVAERILETEPFRTYQGLINIVRVDAVSRESGVTDPSQGVRRDTALGVRHDFFSPHGINTARPWRIWRATRGTPWDTAVVIANSPRRGGATVPFASFTVVSYPHARADQPVADSRPRVEGVTAELSASPAQFTPPFDPAYPGTWGDYAADAAVHELGHACPAHLADEYAKPMREHGTRNLWSVLMDAFVAVARPLEAAGIFQIAPNVSLSPDSPPWRRWLADPADGVSIVEGALLRTSGAYRPTVSCKMARERDAFCPVCREALILRAIYRCARPGRVKWQSTDSRFRYSLERVRGLTTIHAYWRVGNVTRPELNDFDVIHVPEAPSRVTAVLEDRSPWIRGLSPTFVLRPEPSC